MIDYGVLRTSVHLPPTRSIRPCFFKCCCAVRIACFHFLPKRCPSIRSRDLRNRHKGLDVWLAPAEAIQSFALGHSWKAGKGWSQRTPRASGHPRAEGARDHLQQQLVHSEVVRPLAEGFVPEPCRDLEVGVLCWRTGLAPRSAPMRPSPHTKGRAWARPSDYSLLPTPDSPASSPYAHPDVFPQLTHL